mmetsp:Transcript_841/g.2078  ORF Transcript_841/g.2078 Transcript_841/m.2078 type:complete len:121 (-) Transcript_841:288-650(-)
MSNDEIQSRIKCVQNWKRQMDDVRADLTGGFGKTSSKGSREALLGSKQEQEERAKAKKALERDNQEFMEGEGMRQQLIHEELNVVRINAGTTKRRSCHDATSRSTSMTSTRRSPASAKWA